jgi:hypothetical protein
MMTSKRIVLIVLAALIVGTLAAVVVAGLGGNAPAQPGANAQSQILGEDTAAGTGDLADTAAVDPAKQQPTLDKFSSKDPFIPLTVASTSNTGGTGGTGGGTEQPNGAVVKVNDSKYTVKEDSKVSIFTISSITTSGVTFALPEGRQFDDGSSSVVVGVGESVKVTSEDTGKSYTLYVVSLSYPDGSSGGGNTSGHSISVVSINEQNGTAVCTIEVDGKTYADKEVGDTFDTGWGQIKILSINVSAQTVTIMHGDATITLHAGQVVTK